MTLTVINSATSTSDIEQLIKFLRDEKLEGALPLAAHLGAALAEVIRLRAQFGEALGKDFSARRITLCGSARFALAYREWTARLMIDESAMVYTAPLVDTLTDEQKERIDQLWLAQIAASDAIFVLNVDGYIGESTAAEIAFARDKGVAVRFLSGEAPGWTEADCRFASGEQGVLGVDPGKAVYRRDECIFNFCSDPDVCKASDRCAQPRDTSPAEVQDA